MASFLQSLFEVVFIDSCFFMIVCCVLIMVLLTYCLLSLPKMLEGCFTDFLAGSYVIDP